LRGPAEPYTPLLGGFPASPGSFTDQVPLELGDAGKNRHDHFPSVRCCVGPGLRNGPEFATGFTSRTAYISGRTQELQHELLAIGIPL